MSYPPPPAQPAYPGGGYAAPAPNNNMPISIGSLVAGVLCGGCLGAIPGIIAVVNAGKVGNLAAQGDQAGAQTAAANARKWAIIGFVVTAVLFVLIVGANILLGAAAEDNNTTY